MTKLLVIAIQILIFIPCLTFSQDGKNYKREIEPYVEFLKNQQKNPVDYILELFEKYAIVILGERDHRDTTQYDFILKLINDKRFIEKVGNIFTEVGVYNQTESTNKLLQSDNLTDIEFERKLLVKYRDLDFNPIWDKYNFYKYLKGVYAINKTLSKEKKLNVFLTDCSFTWDGMTKESYALFDKKVSEGTYRDSVMASNMINEFKKILQTNSHRKKALVIFNTPHAYRTFKCLENGKVSTCAASYIFEKFPDRTANVFINWIRLSNHQTINDGKWDAAFRILGNPSLGFDFLDSPFGNDLFDNVTNESCIALKYQDIFTGFIFFQPIEKWVATIGIPALVDDEFAKELIKRKEILEKKSTPDMLKRYYNNKRSFDCNRNRKLLKTIKYWLE
jgi:hypothetical protein